MEVNRFKQNLGAIGEQISCGYLTGINYEIIDRNYRYKRFGEIDIIAREKDSICFVEVKTRRNLNFGAPSEAVTVRKQERMRKLAYIYLKEHKIKDLNIRFDIIEVLYKSQLDYKINFIINAF